MHKHQELFEYLSNEHGIIALESELDEIVTIVLKENNSLPNGEAQDVSENEQTKKVCDCDDYCRLKKHGFTSWFTDEPECKVKNLALSGVVKSFVCGEEKIGSKRCDNLCMRLDCQQLNHEAN